MLVTNPCRRFIQNIARSFPRRQRPRRRRTNSEGFAPNVPALVECLETRQLLSAASVVVNSAAGAANYASTVTIAQLNPSTTPVTLRDAINAVNNTAGAANITFDSSVFAAGQSTITLTGAPLTITNTTGMITIQGSATDQISISGNNLSGVFQVNGSATAEIDHLTVTGGMASLGAGINNMGTLTLNGDTIVGNNASANASVNQGAGIANSGTLNVINTTITGNSVSGGAFIDEGGGLFTQAGAVVITDSTIANNTAISPVTGAATGGGLAWGGGSAIRLSGSILAGNTTTVGAGSALTGDFIGNAANIDATSSFNLVGDGTNTGLTNGVLGNIVGTAGAGAVNAQLSALANNGGAVETMALASTSAAIGAGAAFNDALGNPITVDARGVARVAGSIDIGAYQTAAGATFSGEYAVATSGSTTLTLASITQSGTQLTLNGSASATATVTGPFTLNVGGVTANVVNDTITFGATGTFAGQVWTKLNLPANFTTQAGTAAHVTMNGPNVTFTDQFGNTSAATWISPTQLSVFGATATVANGQITFSDGTVWNESVSLSGTATARVAGPVSITATGTSLGTSGQITVSNFVNASNGTFQHAVLNGTNTIIFVNGHGSMVLGTMISANQAIIPSWNNDVATFANGSVTFSDGTVWHQQISGAAALSITDYVNLTNGRIQHAVQNGTSTAVFINARGSMTLGTFTSANVATIAAWNNDVATFGAAGVTFSDGSNWVQTSASASVTDTLYVNPVTGMVHEMIKNGSTIVFIMTVNGHANVALGTQTSPTTIVVSAWNNDTATIGAGGRIDWSDGSFWVPDPNPQILVTATDSVGAAALLELKDANTLIGLGGSLQGATGTRLNGSINWSNGDVWSNFDLNALNAFFEMRTTFP